MSETHVVTDKEFVRFQLIPFSDIPNRAPVGEVIERRIKEGQVIRIGRQIVRDGQPIVKGNKQATDIDIWFTSKVVSRLHAEMWVKDSQIYIKDIGSSSGIFLNKMRLSPSGKESRPYPVNQGDVVQLGVDYRGKSEDIYKSVIMKIGFFDQQWLRDQKKKANPVKYGLQSVKPNARSEKLIFIIPANPYGTSNDVDPEDTAAAECCICIGSMTPFQALFVAPCSHCYHFKCIAGIIAQSAMFQCPLCRQVANLTASVSTESLHPYVKLDSNQMKSENDKQNDDSEEVVVTDNQFSAGAFDSNDGWRADNSAINSPQSPRSEPFEIISENIQAAPPLRKKKGTITSKVTHILENLSRRATLENRHRGAPSNEQPNQVDEESGHQAGKSARRSIIGSLMRGGMSTNKRESVTGSSSTPANNHQADNTSNPDSQNGLIDKRNVTLKMSVSDEADKDPVQQGIETSPTAQSGTSTSLQINTNLQVLNATELSELTPTVKSSSPESPVSIQSPKTAKSGFEKTGKSAVSPKDYLRIQDNWGSALEPLRLKDEQQKKHSSFVTKPVSHEHGSSSHVPRAVTGNTDQNNDAAASEDNRHVAGPSSGIVN